MSLIFALWENGNSTQKVPSENLSQQDLNLLVEMMIDTTVSFTNK